MCDVHYLRSLCVHLHLSDLFPPAPLGLDGDFGEGSVRQLVSPRVGGVCVCVFATAYPFRIPVKLNQHFSFVFGLALAIRRPAKDIHPQEDVNYYRS